MIIPAALIIAEHCGLGTAAAQGGGQRALAQASGGGPRHCRGADGAGRRRRGPSEAELRQHKSQYWLTSKDKRKAPEQYQADVEKLCETYQTAAQLAAEGTHVISTDEKTRMQALERLHETKPVRPGLVERVEFEYIRHGTLCLIANLDVATGKIVCPTIGPTRTEADFVAHIDQTIATDPEAGWIFVADQLDTHVSATLVELAANSLTETVLTKAKNSLFVWSRCSPSCRDPRTRVD